MYEGPLPQFFVWQMGDISTNEAPEAFWKAPRNGYGRGPFDQGLFTPPGIVFQIISSDHDSRIDFMEIE